MFFCLPVFSNFPAKKKKKLKIQQSQSYKKPVHIFHSIYVSLMLILIKLSCFQPCCFLLWFLIAETQEPHEFLFPESYIYRMQKEPMDIFIHLATWSLVVIETSFFSKIELNSIQPDYFSKDSQEFFFKPISSDTQINAESSCRQHCCLVCNCSILDTQNLIFRVILASGCNLNCQNWTPKRDADSFYHSFSLLPSCTAIFPFGL